MLRLKLISNLSEQKEHHRNNCGRNAIKTPSTIPSDMSIFCNSAKLLKLLNKYAVNIEDKYFNIECNATENISVN